MAANLYSTRSISRLVLFIFLMMSVLPSYAMLNDHCENNAITFEVTNAPENAHQEVAKINCHEAASEDQASNACCCDTGQCECVTLSSTARTDTKIQIIIAGSAREYSSVISASIHDVYLPLLYRPPIA